MEVDASITIKTGANQWQGVSFPRWTSSRACGIARSMFLYAIACQQLSALVGAGHQYVENPAETADEALDETPGACP